MVPESVDQKPSFAGARPADVKALIEANRLAVDSDARRQFTQEFGGREVGIDHDGRLEGDLATSEQLEKIEAGLGAGR